MQLHFVKSLISAGDLPCKITAICCSPNNLKIAVVTADRVVYLYDEIGERRDKFATKPGDPSLGKKHYQVKGLGFSPDSTKLAVGQTDNIIFVYRIGEQWGEKKVICNKFIQQSAITCLVWPHEQSHFVFGTAEGKVRLANVRANKSHTLFATESYVVSLASSPSGKAIVSGHVDGSIVHYSLEAGEGAIGAQGQLCRHSCAPYALAWVGQAVIAAGNDRRVCFYSEEGRLIQNLDYTMDADEKEFTVAAGAPGGQAVAIGSFDRIRVYNWSPKKSHWDETGGITIANLYTVTSLAWKKDGSKLIVGGLCGSADMFDCCLRRSVYKHKFEMTYVGLSQVIVKNLTSGARVILKSHYGYEIEQVKIMGNDRYLVAHTSDTLLLGDLTTCRLSEVAWGESGGNEKFYFETESACMIFNVGELTLVEYGTNEVLGSVRTEFINPHLVSLRINERRFRNSDSIKKIAYLLDAKTISVYDLVNNFTEVTHSHESRIDWLELNETCRKLLFRDKKLRLHLLDLQTDSRTSLLEYCSYVQWVPHSDVVVAQGRGSLCVWYNIDSPERQTTFAMKGDIVELERMDGRTEVVVQSGVDTVSYTLDEGLIEFGTAIEDGDFGRAVVFLESLEMSPETEGMWQTLANRSLERSEILVAARSFAAVGNITKSFYLQDTLEMIENETDCFIIPPAEAAAHWICKARLAALNGDLRLAEIIYVEQGKVELAMELYQTLHMWEEALRVARENGLSDIPKLKEGFLKHLVDTGQEERAGTMKEQEGEYGEAINLYMRAGLPSKACSILLQHPSLSHQSELVERIAAALIKGGLYEKAGELFEQVNMAARALENYRKGRAYRKAVELARQLFSSDVVVLEEEWANYLRDQKQFDTAINHYIEAGSLTSAAECAIEAKQWTKATQIIDSLEGEVAGGFYKQLAEHYKAGKQYELAEKYFEQAALTRSAVDMYTSAGMWEAAHKLALRCMSGEEVEMLYANQAKDFEVKGRLKEAERLYVMIEDPDKAIAMYKKHRQYDSMIRLIGVYYKDLLTDSHLRVARELESEGSFREAEQHYISARDWKSVCHMYRTQDMWEDAYRVAKAHGGSASAKQVAIPWAKHLGGESAVKLLNRLGMLEESIDYAAEHAAFDFAFEIATSAVKSKLPELHLKYAMHLEDEGKYTEAEENFVKASRPKEAVLMYVHTHQWENAQRVAELHDPASLKDVLIGQAKLCFEEKNFPQGESYLLRAQRPDLIVSIYLEGEQWQDAMRVAREYVPQMLDDVKDKMLARSSGSARDMLDQAKSWEQAGDQGRAVEIYLQLNREIIDDTELLTSAWCKAAELSIKFMPSRAPTLVLEITDRLTEIRKYIEAAEILLEVNLTKDALELLISGEHWERARQVVTDRAPQYRDYIESAYAQKVRDRQQPDEIVSVDVAAALEMYAESQKWDKCLQVAESTKNDQLLNKYIARYAASLIKDGNSLQALRLYKKYGAPPNPQNFNIYKRIALEILSQPFTGIALFIDYSELRDMLYDLIIGFRKASLDETEDCQYFTKLLHLSHWHATRSACHPHKQLSPISAKLSVCMLRYTDLLPADKCFYEAGCAAREQGWGGMAFVFLNRFLDLCEAIEEQNLDGLDHTDFLDTDIPFEIPLPDLCTVSDAKREEAKEWVLTVSVDQSVEQSLPKDSRGVFQASLTSPSQAKPANACVITGYPTIKDVVNFKFGSHSANKEDWNTLILGTKQTHSAECNNIVHFITSWCGTPIK